ncbi:MAG: ATP-dependent DNA ligase [Tistlia sp.]|uniref:ATP-dependent DNA ligase n=1 Tax=Tistlia sp. TaxID=3057121 RepID=UPI0034A44D1D
MEAKSVAALPEGPGWQYEPKWDGFRCLAWRAGVAVTLTAKSGKPLARYFPEVVALLRGLPLERFLLDGELVVPLEGKLSFDALQQRLHPAESRVRRLAAETPASLLLFDCLLDPEGGSLLAEPLSARRAALERLYRALPAPGDEGPGDEGPAGEGPRLRLSPATRELSEARAWLQEAGGALDGVVAKRLEAPYRPGERAMLKVKCLRTADCVVGGFRYAAEGKDKGDAKGGGKGLVGSLLLGLHDGEGRLHHVGFTSGLAAKDKPALTRRLEALVEPPGFTGKAPGGPSRWASARDAEWQPLRPELVVEVRYDQVTGDRFRHGTRLLRWRLDKAPRQCTFEQLERAARPEELERLWGR